MAPGVEAYTSLVAGYADKGKLSQAFKTVNAMKAEGIEPNSFTLTALMNACFRADDISSARELLKKTMEENSKSKDILRTLYGSFVIGLSKQGDQYAFEAKNAFFDMIKTKLAPDTATMNAVIQNMCTGRSALEALELARAMIQEGFHPDDFTYSILFTALGRAGEVEVVSRLFETANMTFDSTSINSMLQAYASSADPLACVRVFEKLVKHDYQKGEVEYFAPTKVTYTIIFSAILQSAAAYSMQSSDSPSTVSSLTLKDYDTMTRKFYKSMRFNYNIDVDKVMIGVLNRLCNIKALDGNGSLFSSQKLQTLITKESARFILDDLLVLGYRPDEIRPILDACDYPPWKQQQILDQAPSTKRRNSASYKLFKKYGWNKVESGWSSLF